MGHLGARQVGRCQLELHLIDDFLIRRSFADDLAPQGARMQAEPDCHFFQRGELARLAQQAPVNLADDAAPAVDAVQHLVAGILHQLKGDGVGAQRTPLQPGLVEAQLGACSIELDRTVQHAVIMGGPGWRAERETGRAQPEGVARHAFMQRQQDAALVFLHEALHRFMQRKVRQGADDPDGVGARFIEFEVDDGCGQFSVGEPEIDGVAHGGAAEQGVAVKAVVGQVEGGAQFQRAGPARRQAQEIVEHGGDLLPRNKEIGIAQVGRRNAGAGQRLFSGDVVGGQVRRQRNELIDRIDALCRADVFDFRHACPPVSGAGRGMRNRCPRFVDSSIMTLDDYHIRSGACRQTGQPRSAGNGSAPGQTKALKPVTALPTIRLFISRVPS